MFSWGVHFAFNVLDSDAWVHSFELFCNHCRNQVYFRMGSRYFEKPHVLEPKQGFVVDRCSICSDMVMAELVFLFHTSDECC